MNRRLTYVASPTANRYYSTLGHYLGSHGFGCKLYVIENGGLIDKRRDVIINQIHRVVRDDISDQFIIDHFSPINFASLITKENIIKTIERSDAGIQCSIKVEYLGNPNVYGKALRQITWENNEKKEDKKYWATSRNCY